MDEEIRSNLEAGFNKLFNSPVVIKKKRRNKELKKKSLFISLISQYEQSLNRSLRLQSEFNIDLFDYEESYYSIIDKLMLLVWGGDIYDVMVYYLYERTNLDGSLNCIVETTESGEEIEIFLKTPEDLYNYLMRINPNFLTGK